jgi:large subunit ribosomal protein L14e
MYDVGRVCLKIAGREAGRYCVIVKKIDDKFVMVTGPKGITQVKRRRCNITHLEPLTETIKIKSDAPDEEVAKAFESESLVTKLNIEKPVKVRHQAGEKAEKGEKAERKEGKAEAKQEKAGRPKEEKKETVPKAKPRRAARKE